MGDEHGTAGAVGDQRSGPARLRRRVHSATSMPALLEDPDGAPAWFPAAAGRRRPGRAARARRPRLGPAPGTGACCAARPAAWTAARSPRWPRPPPPPRSRRSPPGLTPGEHGVVGYRMSVRRRRRAQRAAVVHLQGRRPRAASRPSPSSTTSPSSGQRPPVVARAEFARLRLHPGPPGRLPPRPATACPRPWWPRSCTCCRPASRSSTPTTTASTRSPTSTAWTSFYDAELVAVDRLVAVPRRGAAAGRRARRHRRPRPGRRGRPACSRRTPTVLAHVGLQSGEARFRWLHALPGSEADLLAAAAEAHHADVAWVVTREQVLDEGWFGPKVLAAVAGAGSATWRS